MINQYNEAMDVAGRSRGFSGRAETVLIKSLLKAQVFFIIQFVDVFCMMIMLALVILLRHY